MTSVGRREEIRRLMREEERAFVKVNVVGLGGCGNNTINNLAKEKLEAVKLVAVNTDAAVLRRTNADERILIGRFTHKGRGARGVPQLGKESMEESVEEALATIDPELDLLIAAAGMGGGTGTGALPVMLREVGLKYRDAVKLAIVTLPLKEEGEERRRNAQLGLKEVLDAADFTVVNANDLALEKMRGADITYAFKTMDRRLARSIAAIVRMQAQTTDPGVINVDFSNFQRLARESGLGFIGVGRGADLTDSMEDAMKDDYAESDVTRAMGSIIYFEGSELSLDVGQVRSVTGSFIKRFGIPTLFIGLRPKWGMKDIRTSLVVSTIKSKYVDSFLADLAM